MKTKNLLTIALFFILISCNSSSTFSQFDKMGEDNHWGKSDIKTYEFEIKEDSKFYNVVFEFSHVYDYQFATVPIQFVIESPDGKKETLAIDLAIKDANGKEIGECAGDVCDLDYQIKEKTKLANGTYKIKISHNFKGAPYLPNVIGIGLKVTSVK